MMQKIWWWKLNLRLLPFFSYFTWVREGKICNSVFFILNKWWKWMSSVFAFIQIYAHRVDGEESLVDFIFFLINFIVLIKKTFFYERWTFVGFKNHSYTKTKWIWHLLATCQESLFVLLFFCSKDILLCIHLFLVSHPFLIIIDDYFTLNNLKNVIWYK